MLSLEKKSNVLTAKVGKEIKDDQEIKKMFLDLLVSMVKTSFTICESKGEGLKVKDLKIIFDKTHTVPYGNFRSILSTISNGKAKTRGKGTKKEFLAKEFDKYIFSYLESNGVKDAKKLIG